MDKVHAVERKTSVGAEEYNRIKAYKDKKLNCWNCHLFNHCDPRKKCRLGREK